LPMLKALLAQWWQADRNRVPYLRILSHLGEPAAQDRVYQLALDAHADVGTRQVMLQIVGETAQPRYLAGLLSFVGPQQPEPLQLAALRALEQYEQPEIARHLVGAYAGLKDRLRSGVRQVLLSRKSWALALLEEVDAGRIAAKEFPVDELRQIALLDDEQLNRLVRKHWGDIRSGTPEEKLAEMRRLSNDLRARPGNPANGRLLFNKHCATCHRLYEEGNRVGPDLTYANRHDRDYLLVSVVDPSAVVRKEYVSYVVHTDGGQLLAGLLVAQTPRDVTLLNAKNERTTIPRAKIESIAESPTSLMPENLLKQLKPAEVRDLFSYLQTDKPVASRK
jgi:putative heme-binding domain-containing protein